MALKHGGQGWGWDVQGGEEDEVASNKAHHDNFVGLAKGFSFTREMGLLRELWPGVPRLLHFKQNVD